jgi:hypothetical protein
MVLQESKRLKNEDDKKILRQLKESIFDNSIPVKTTIEKYFKIVSKIETINNIAYSNEMCSIICKEVRKMLNKTDEYQKGEYLVCRKYFKHTRAKGKYYTFNVNFKYKIMKIHSNGDISIMDPLYKNIYYRLPITVIRSNFIFEYVRTGHSTQGVTIDDKITIFDWNHFYVTRKWIWTAITRATDLKNVVFYKPTDPKLTEKLLHGYFERKIQGYKKQDRAANRTIDESTYVNQEWLRTALTQNCRCCGLHFNINVETLNNNTYVVRSDLTADRIDNSIAHQLDNIRCYHTQCNVESK